MTLKSNAKKMPHAAPEQTVPALREQMERLQSELVRLQKAVEALEERVRSTARRYIAVCPGCQTQFDMLAHHYSIGLFDNLVYVKCPKCHKALPVKGGSGGEVGTVVE